jgi:prepilin peptidase CpaA
VGALKDATSYTIPNWIPLGLVAAFPLAALAGGVPLSDLGLHLAVGLAGLILGIALFAARWVGGGDAKLLAAAALWLGWPAATTFLLTTAVWGGVLTLALVALRSAQLRPLVMLGPGWVARLAEPGGGVPYGIAIAAGVLLTFPDSPLGKGLPF